MASESIKIFEKIKQYLVGDVADIGCGDEPIVEGAFDAIATKRNTIPLFGKKILPKLRTQILHHKVPRINLALDADAYKDSIVEIEYFLNNNIRVHYVELGSKDPNEMGYHNMIDAIGEAREITFFDLIQYKMTL